MTTKTTQTVLLHAQKFAPPRAVVGPAGRAIKLRRWLLIALEAVGAFGLWAATMFLLGVI